MLLFDISHIHPMLVHFPIALILVGFFAEAISLVYKKEVCLSKCGFYLLLLGTLAGIVTWLSGDLFTAEMSGAAGDMRETHEYAALVSVAMALLTLTLRIYLLLKNNQKDFMKVLAFVLYAITAACIGLTGALGGTLVYSYMMPI